MILFKEQKTFLKNELEREKKEAKKMQESFLKQNNKEKIIYYEGVIDFISKLLNDLK